MVEPQKTSPLYPKNGRGFSIIKSIFFVSFRQACVGPSGALGGVSADQNE